MNNNYFVTGIGTGIGKTIASAVLAEKLNADYWKPIQSGDLDQSDSLTVESLISNTKTIIHPETYRLTQPLSPHLSAKLDGTEITLNSFTLPETTRSLIVEGAGGLMVPLNNKDLILDLIIHLNLETIVVSSNYLGSINHTLLTINVLKQYGIKIKGILFCGEENTESQSYILNYTGLPFLGRIPQLKNLDKSSIKEAAQYINLA